MSTSLKDKVLIIEDEQSISNFISTILSTNGYDTLVAVNGTDALRIINISIYSNVNFRAITSTITLPFGLNRNRFGVRRI